MQRVIDFLFDHVPLPLVVIILPLMFGTLVIAVPYGVVWLMNVLFGAELAKFIGFIVSLTILILGHVAWAIGEFSKYE